INAGDNGLIPVGVTTDLAGSVRIQQTIVDMGAYESPFVPPLPVMTISATDDAGSETGNDPITFRIERTGSTASPLLIYFTLGGTATNGVDYLPALGIPVTIPAGQAFLDITLTPINDDLDESNETVTL